MKQVQFGPCFSLNILEAQRTQTLLIPESQEEPPGTCETMFGRQRWLSSGILQISADIQLLKMTIEIDEMVDFPMKNGKSFHSDVKLPEGIQNDDYGYSTGKVTLFRCPT